jgi:isopentenyl phosphate kinase
MRAVTIYLSDNQDVSDWMRKEITAMLGKRYKLTHLSEDMNVNYAKLYRFMRGKNVGTEIYDSFFRVYLRQWNS